LVTKRGGETVVATIQPMVENATPWPKIWFGDNRNPYDLISLESRYEPQLLDHLAILSNEAKNSFAAGLCVSQNSLNESLHSGQVMCVTEETEKKESKIDKDILRFVLIDAGARCRHALVRWLGNKNLEIQDEDERTLYYDSSEDEDSKSDDKAKKSDFEFKTSEKYAASGQWFKDYLSYYLKDPDISAFVYVFWSKLREQDIPKFVEKQIDYFLKQLKVIPKELHMQTLNEVYDIYAKGSSIKRKPKQNISPGQIKWMMRQVFTTNFTQLRAIAKEKIDSLLTEVNRNSRSYGFSSKIMSDIHKKNYPVYDIVKSLNKRMQYSHNHDESDKLMTKLSENYQFLAYLYASISLKKTPSDDAIFDKMMIELLQIKISMLQRLMKYLNHLTEKAKGSEKIILVTEAIGKLIISYPQDYPEIINSLQPICNHRLLKSGPSKGMIVFSFLGKKSERLQKTLKSFKRVIEAPMKTYDSSDDKRNTEEVPDQIKSLDWFGSKRMRIADNKPKSLVSDKQMILLPKRNHYSGNQTIKPLTPDTAQLST
jgi:hypothetical protein